VNAPGYVYPLLYALLSGIGGAPKAPSSGRTGRMPNFACSGSIVRQIWEFFSTLDEENRVRQYRLDQA
jgi:hypothetical protein